ncbi:hypothetical protein AAFF_G00141980 [Aldrovandia affinis]|uniref:Uncharacterized protein n=1 Tax=Aldrovandia affinis TaxID=143900 RepID=A0AAD7TCJ3_9TELE|nr:hypothetical protein AAFF_G00141980 [Aldrovandia affinis]
MRGWGLQTTRRDTPDHGDPEPAPASPRTKATVHRIPLDNIHWFAAFHSILKVARQNKKKRDAVDSSPSGPVHVGQAAS